MSNQALEILAKRIVAIEKELAQNRAVKARMRTNTMPSTSAMIETLSADDAKQFVMIADLVDTVAKLENRIAAIETALAP